MADAIPVSYTHLKLLPQLELEFDIPIEKVERQKVGIMIKKKYIPFDVNKYGEIKDVYPDLCPDFILYNQAAVSYTHLDVYKRQLYECVKPFL